MKPIQIAIEAQTSGDAEIAALNKQLDDLAKQQTLIDSFVKLKKETESAVLAFQDAQTKAQTLGRDIAATVEPTKTQVAEFERARIAVASTGDAYQELRLKLQSSREQLTAVGISTSSLARSQTELREQVVSVGASMDARRQVLSSLARAEQEAAAAASAHEGALKRSSAETKSANDLAATEISLSRQVLGLEREQQQAMLRSAEARGDEVAAQSASNRLREIEVEQLRLSARSKREEAAAIDAAADKRRGELSAIGPLTKAQQLELQNSANLAKSLRVESAAHEVAASAVRTHAVNIDSAASGVGRYQGALTQVAGAVAGAFAVGRVVEYAKSVQEVSDSYKNLEARIKLAVGEQSNLQDAVAGVGKVAIATHTNLDATAELFGRLAASSKELGINNEQALLITKTINQSIQVSGATAQASEAAVRQLVQALQSGTLRGDEFNSIMEQAPRLARALADGLNVPVGALRGMAEQGQLTSAVVVKALQGQSAAIEREFATLPLTVGRAVTNLQTQWTLFIGGLTGGAAQSSVAAQAINSLANNLDTLAAVATRAGAVLTAALAIQGVQALRAFAAEMLTTGKAASIMSLELSKVPKVINITVAAVGLEVGYQIGQVLYENFETARKLGVAIVGFGQALVNDLMFIKEAAAAIFTNDTVDAAFERYRARGREMDAILEDMWQDAAKAPNAIAGAADSGAAGLGKLGVAGMAAGQAVAAGGQAGAVGVHGIAKAAGDAHTALAGLATALNFKALPSAGISGIVQELVAAKLRGEDLDLQLRQRLPEAIGKLNGSELSKFRSEFKMAMDSAKADLQAAIDTKKPRAEIDALRAKVDSFEKATRTGMILIAEQAAQNLGVDVPLAFGKVTKEFESMRSNLSVLIRQLPDLKAAGVDTGSVVAQALSKMIDGAKSKAELDKVMESINSLKGEMSEPLYNGFLDQLNDKAKDLKESFEKASPGIQSVDEALRQLGITTDQSLKDVAAKSKEAFDFLTAAGTASAREISEAFKKSATEAIEANNGIAPEWVKAQAAVRGFRVEVDASGKATVVSMREAADAVKSVGNAARTAAGEFDALGNKIDFTSEKARKLYQDGQVLAAMFEEKNQQTSNSSITNNKSNINPIDAVPSFETQEQADAWWEEWSRQYQAANPNANSRGGMLGSGFQRDTTRAEWEAEIRAMNLRNTMKGNGNASESTKTPLESMRESQPTVINLHVNGVSVGMVQTNPMTGSNSNTFVLDLERAARNAGK